MSGQLDNDSAHNLFVVQIDFEKLNKPRAQLMEELKKKGIRTQVHFIPLYRHPLLRDQQDEEMQASFPQMELYYSQALSLPLYYSLEESDIAKICNELISALLVS